MAGALKMQVNADGQNMDLVFKFGTMRMAEQELGHSLTASMADGMGFNEVSAIFWAALQPSHRMTREASDNIVDQIGVPEVTALVVKGVNAVFGTAPEDAAPEEVPAGEAKAGTAQAK